MNAVAEKKKRIAAATIRAAVYVRISEDRKGEGLGVQRQEKACRGYAETRGWSVEEVYLDNDVSAVKNKPRPEYQRMLADMEAGLIDAVVCWDQDRLVRKPEELEHFISLADLHKIALGTTTGHVDLATPGGRMFARMLGAYAAYEGEHKAERMVLKWAQNAEAGKPHMGGTRPFGYVADRVTVNPVEAAHIRDAAQRVLAGATLRSIAQDWNAQGALTPTGRTWAGQTVKQVLLSARISGRREVKGKGGHGTALGTIVRDDCWEAIISVEDSDRLRAMLSNPARRSHNRGTNARHLLTGLLRCGRCGARMVALNWQAGGKFLYRCPSPGQANNTTCGSLSVLRKHVEPTVRVLLLARIESSTFWDMLAQRDEVDPAVGAQVDSDEQTLTDLAADFANGDLTRAEWVTARDIVKLRLEAGRTKMARATRTTALHQLSMGEGSIADRFDALPVMEQRAIFAEVMEEVRVHPVIKLGGVWDPKRIEPIYRF